MFKKLKSIFSSSEEPQKETAEVVDSQQDVVESESIQAAPIKSEPVKSESVEPTPGQPEAAGLQSVEPEIVKPEPADEPAFVAESVKVAELTKVDLASESIVGTPEKETPSGEPESVKQEPVQLEPVKPDPVKEEPAKKGMFARMKAGLSRTKANLSEKLGNLFLGKKEIDDELLEDIETLLLTADVGVEATTEIIGRLTARVERNQLADAQALHESLKQELGGLLAQVEQPLVVDPKSKPYVILMVGVNGVGKTTTIGKLTKRFQNEGKSVMLAAGDTFRAAAVEQLQVWGDRNNVPVVAQHTGADSASVVFDALQSAKTKNIDVLIADTAGRLQNKDHLMQELEKVVRVMRKMDGSAPHEVMLVLDAGTGQNAMSQARVFKDSVGVTGIALTKLDGTAKGGIIFAIAKQLQLPIRFIGVGEQIDDLRPFVAEEFVAALFD
ncbi:signal recognition particle-docking protein FtsY [Neptunomonas antarctica]|uniref:Signal recognition particle receptor FtsY n=1 Tax=Neptunomonas antarctica TaxID=619304 RepID=A0A1N7KBJ5_9GAMM|nr:signal recognition particle-docking protein FtsY [Neptunomonas antarctica]SIS58909.1 signal recognition particle-docking protein FtsY [Neptunomonas antarctica]